MDVEAVFHKPFEVTQFWISNNYDGHSVGDDDGYIVFRTNSDKPGKWFLEVCIGKGRPFVGDFIPPFLPTRKNIATLNAAVNSMAETAYASERAGEFVPPKFSPLAGIKASSVPVTRDINDENYRKALFRVLATDWGMLLPNSPSKFGEQIIHLKYRRGLPCGAAMVSAVEPILEAVWGSLKKRQVATGQTNGMTIDTVTYSGESFTERKQLFDITEYFGKDLPYVRFSFNPDDPKIIDKEVADDVVQGDSEESDDPPRHTGRFLKFLIQWHVNSKNNRKTYEEITKKQAPSYIENFSDPVDLYTAIYRNFGVRITDEEDSELRRYAPLLDAEAARSVKRVSSRIASEQMSGGKPDDVLNSARIPSFGLMRFLMMLPNIVLLVAIVSVFIKGFSWVVLGTSLFGKIWNGYARWLAGQHHPSAGFHIAIALIAIATGLILSLLHLSGIATFR